MHGSRDRNSEADMLAKEGVDDFLLFGILLLK